MLQNRQSAIPLVPERQILCGTSLDKNILGCPIQNETVHSLDLTGDDGGSRFQAGEDDLARLIRVVHAVIGANGSAAAIDHLEGNASQRLVLRALDVLVDDQRGGRLIVKGQAVGNATLDHNGPGRFILDVTDGSLVLGYDDGGIGG